MTLVTDLDLPDFDLSNPALVGEAYHLSLAALRQQSWLARSPIALLVLDREAGEFFLRARGTAFPGRQIAELFGITAGPLFEHIDANILNLSDVTHRRLRGIVAGAFTSRAADQWRPVMLHILEQLWAGLKQDAQVEVVAAMANYN
jgi:cytochrome P450